MIIYFTGTHNSEYVANIIKEETNDQIICANDYIKASEKGIFNSDKPYIFVFPVYISTIPAIFRQFIEESSFNGNKNAYFIPTCAKTDGSTPNSAIDLCKKTNLKYKGTNRIVMPQNYITLFNPTSKDIKKKQYENAIVELKEICKAIKHEEKLNEIPRSNFEYIITKQVEILYNKYIAKTKKFYATNACIGCGMCEKGCPTNTIKIKDGKPIWISKTCIHCFTCLNCCPKNAIEYGKMTINKERHVCPPYKK